MQRTNKDIQCVWKYVKPTEEELKQILADHKDWLNGGREGEPPHNLSGANLGGAKLNGANLRGADFSGTNLVAANLNGADLSGAQLFNANLSKSQLSHATIKGAYLIDGNFTGASLVEADLSEAFLNGTNFSQSDLRHANLSGTRLWSANFNMANLRGADLSDADVSWVKYKKLSSCRGIKAETCYGAPRFRRYVMDQDYIEELNYTIWGVFKRFFWWLLADYGRSAWRWVLWSVGLALFFAWKFQSLGPGAFDIKSVNGIGLPQNFETMLYYSVVTFTTLGFGDVTPLTPEAARWVMSEVIVGYIMLGGLISIMATKLARRAG